MRDLPVHPRSRAWLSHMSTSRDLHPDFGPSYGAGPDYGIPVTVVGGAHPTVKVRFDHADESDHVRYVLGAGLVLADNGSPWYFQGEQHARWSDRLVSDLKQIPASAFVAVDTAPLRVSRDSAATR